mmetsp:Transcript_8435/g.26144  ORF Transcript_8435/g.26144 Transcript_8435/m.26144 type:complete len:376 (+) Transcript_8435:169-1296(+)
MDVLPLRKRILAAFQQNSPHDEPGVENGDDRVVSSSVHAQNGPSASGESSPAAHGNQPAYPPSYVQQPHDTQLFVSRYHDLSAAEYANERMPGDPRFAPTSALSHYPSSYHHLQRQAYDDDHHHLHRQLHRDPVHFVRPDPRFGSSHAGDQQQGYVPRTREVVPTVPSFQMTREEYERRQRARASEDKSSCRPESTKKQRASSTAKSRSKSSKRKKQETLCICRQDPRTAKSERFWIYCDGCSNWFHGECVRVTPEMASNLKQFYCPNCVKRKKTAKKSTDKHHQAKRRGTAETPSTNGSKGDDTKGVRSKKKARTIVEEPTVVPLFKEEQRRKQARDREARRLARAKALAELEKKRKEKEEEEEEEVLELAAED